MTSNPQMPGCAGTNLINLIYTKLSTFPSSKISQIIHLVFAGRHPPQGVPFGTADDGRDSSLFNSALSLRTHSALLRASFFCLG